MVCWKRLAIVCASPREAGCYRMKSSRDSCAKRRFTTETQRHREAFSFKFQVSSFEFQVVALDHSKLKNSLWLGVSVVNSFLPRYTKTMHTSATAIDLRSDTVRSEEHTS